MGSANVSYSLSQIARLAGVTVRMLHYYDEIGLSSPAQRSGSGQGGYGGQELRRLQRILFYREFGFSVEDITDLVNDPDAEPAEHLRRQHQLLTARLERTNRLVEAVEMTMEAEKMGISLSPAERLAVFGHYDPQQHGDEPPER